jgi:hypothetical protein
MPELPATDGYPRASCRAWQHGELGNLFTAAEKDTHGGA